MMSKKDEAIKKIISNNKKYIFFKNDKIKKSRYIYKLVFSFILIEIIIVLSGINITNKNTNETIKLLAQKKINEIGKKEKLFLKRVRSILDKDEILENEMMNKHTTFELGGPAKFFITPKSINKIIKIIKLCKYFSMNYFILGNGSNLLVSDKGFNGLVIKIHEENFSNLKVEQIDNIFYKAIVGGGILMRTLAKKLCLLSLSGLEDIIDIPGTIGGGIIMNASAGLRKGLIYDSLDKVKVITPEGEIKELSKKECQLRGRGSMLKDNRYLVIEATFNLFKEDKMIIQKTMTDHTSIRYSKQPMYFPSAGCFFMWSKPKFGSLYSKYKENNLPGFRIGDAMIYTHNIAFIVNLGNAKSSDVYELSIHIEKIFKNKYNIDIMREVILLGSFN